jgi:hypothetical protein
MSIVINMMTLDGSGSTHHLKRTHEFICMFTSGMLFEILNKAQISLGNT